MNPTQKQIGALLFAFVLTVSVVAPVSAGLADSGATDDVQLADSTADIDESLQDASGETEIVVRLERPSSDIVEAQGANALQSHAEQTQAAVEEFAAKDANVQVDEQFWIANAMILTVDTDETPLSEVAEIENVVEIHENFDVEVPETPETEAADGPATVEQAGYETTYGLAQVNAPKVWDQFGTQGGSASVAVLDTGVAASHPDIELAQDGFAEFGQNGDIVSTDPFDSGRHGTHTTGTVAGGDASGKYVGVAPNVELYHGAVLTDSGGTFGAIIGGMQWAVDNDVDVISMSLGAEGYYDQMIDPVRNAEDAGTLVIVSSGNSGEGTSGSPANVYNSLAVGATDRNEDVTSFSSGEVIDTQSDWGSAAPADWPSQYIVPDVTGPGNQVESTVPGNSYSELSGTSMAAPHVSGVAALVQSATDRDLTPDEIREALVETARKPSDAPADKDVRYGAGIVDALAAVEYVSPIEDGDVELDVGSATGASGDTVTVDVTADAIQFDPISSYELMIEFDPDVVQLVGVGGGDFDDPQVSVDNDRGVVKLAQVRTDGANSLTLAQLQFEIVTQQTTSTDLTVVESETRVSDTGGDETTPGSIDNGAIEVTQPFQCETPGDVNGDGEVNALDATLAQQYIAGKMDDSEMNSACADFDSDDAIDTGDVIKLLNKIVEFDS